jgi:hypothetical protein
VAHCQRGLSSEGKCPSEYPVAYSHRYMYTHTHTYHTHVQYTQEFESVKHHVIKTVKQLRQGPGDVDADSVVEYIRQDQKISTDVLNRYQVEARLVAQEYLDRKRQGKEASAQDHVMSQSAENVEACSQEGEFWSN